MNILLLGSGGREHALAWKMSQSKKLDRLYIAPGNAGTKACGTNLDISATDFEAIKKAVTDLHIGMVVVGPEDPLVKGIHDFFLSDPKLKNVPVIGPQKQGAQLEGSKDFSKQFMFRHRIPTAAYKTFTREIIEEGYAFIDTLKPPFVLKADGLAAGKGVLIIDDPAEAKKELANMILDSKFGSAGASVVIEEFLNGIELSVFVLTDGNGYKILPAAKDYKRVGEGDTGLNTGGMGAVSPVPFADKDFMQKVEERVVKPTVEGLKKDAIPYKGFIFIGLMNVNGDPFVIEYNCRMGDPETEVVIPRIKTDILDLFEAVANNTLSECTVEIDERTVSTVMMVSGGYPGDYEKNKKISGIDQVSDSIVFHAGTKEENGDILTSGGRVLALTAYGKDIHSAIAASYSGISNISFDKMYYRKDIGRDLIKVRVH